MGICQSCNKEVDLPFWCKYYGQLFCAEHKIPEAHMCPGLPDSGWNNRRYEMESDSIKTPVSLKSFSSRKGKTGVVPVFIILVILVGAGYFVYDSFFGGSYFACEYFNVRPSTPWVDESIIVQSTIINKGNKDDTRYIDVSFNGEPVDAFNLFLQSHNRTYFRYTFNNTDMGANIFEINGLDKDFASTITVTEPDPSVLDRIDYYYQFAEQYVKQTYFIPEDKSVEGLAGFLYALDFPGYCESVFDCSDSSALLEWLLEGAGYHAYLVEKDRHMWVQVETSEGLVAIETTSLLKDDDYSPPGIIETVDGEFKEYTFKYQMFLEWKKKYPADEYGYDPNISFEKWKKDYLIEIPAIGTPDNAGYYQTSNRYESPDILYIGETTENLHTYWEESEFDWWNTGQFDSLPPYSFW
jgi:hypothetical protein